MLYVRGNKRDYDQWADNGATGWSWNDVYSYFLKAENNTDPEMANNEYHSTGGFLTVSTPPQTNALKEAFAAAAPEVGYEYRHINGEKQNGFAKIQGTIRKGRRCCTAKAYLIHAEDRDNLHIVNEAYVQKVGSTELYLNELYPYICVAMLFPPITLQKANHALKAAISREQPVAPLAAYASRLPLYPMDPISRWRSVAQQSNMLPPVALAGNNTGNIWWPRRLTGHCSKWSLLAEGNRWRY
ncbi:Glucose dehydrogenase [FAD, quinone] [Araneus ventricosus]|uniref:Glucose dehydrogenase [FAD, quinone] n=1 Tax=Araneus ventricosus TaxID=182803 RepID=A0A4Y2I7L7_ARAVE|nr:Glucose dehydrogenase [FAD, quinone] [Araneus ventricosus]